MNRLHIIFIVIFLLFSIFIPSVAFGQEIDDSNEDLDDRSLGIIYILVALQFFPFSYISIHQILSIIGREEVSLTKTHINIFTFGTILLIISIILTIGGLVEIFN